MSLPTRDEIVAAIGRLSGTSDGMLLRRYCQIEVNRVASRDEIASGPLQWSEGRRSFARELALMLDAPNAKAATLDHRSADPDAPVPADKPAGPIASARPLARRVAPYSDD